MRYTSIRHAIHGAAVVDIIENIIIRVGICHRRHRPADGGQSTAEEKRQTKR
jgi:hypothetical protein